MRLEVGEMIETNYGTGPYRIERIVRGCTCTHVRDEIESIVRPLPPHVHLWLRDMRDGKPAYLNYYDETTLKSVYPDDEDRIIRLPNAVPVQQTITL